MSETVSLAAVLGHPVAHSRSPALFAHWLRTLGRTGHYVPIDVPLERLEEALGALPRLGFRGVNVTLPLKEAALAAAHQVSDRAARIGAANTLTFADGAIHADNTDGLGFMAALRAGAPEWDASAPVAVLGAGGAARAVLVALSEAGVPEIRLANRTRDRAEALGADLGGPVTVHGWGGADAMLANVGLVVNTTSLGMTGRPPFTVPLDAMSPEAVAFDLVYSPLETGFLAGARARGCTVVDGLGMLLHQAVPGFERWFGATPVVDEAARRAVLAA